MGNKVVQPATGRADAGKAAGDAAPSLHDRDTGSALRSVYQRTVDEAVPDEMLDLLSKLD